MRFLGAVLLGALLAAILAPGPALRAEEEGAHEKALARIRALHERLKLAPRDSYLNYVIATIARREGIDLRREKIEFPLVPVVTGDPAQRTDLFGIVTGVHAVSESLQLTELVSPDGWSATGEIPPGNLTPPNVEAHDYAYPADGPRDAEAALIPADWMYLRFVDGRALAAFCREAQRWTSHVDTFYRLDARFPTDLGRIFVRMGLPDPIRRPAIYEAIPGPIGVGLADTMIREGTATIVVLEPKGIAAPAAAVAETIGGRLVLTNSAAALTRARAVAEKPGVSLAAASDYRLLRSKLPPTKTEAAFVFLSDAFVRRMVGPTEKVLESRRLRCAAHLRTISNAAILHREEKSALPEDLAALREGGYLTKAMLNCPHAGDYDLRDGIVGTCSAHGYLAKLTPVFDQDLVFVTSAEERAYRRYARAYEALWRQYFDPVAVRVERKGDEFGVETIVLPMADSSLYRSLLRTSGGPAVSGAGPIPDDTVMFVSMKICDRFVRGLDPDPLRLEARFGANLKTALDDAFGDRVTLGLIDDELLFDFDLAAFLGDAMRWNAHQNVVMAPVLTALNLPAYITIPVEDHEAARAFLDRLRAGIAIDAARPEGGMHSLRVEAYDSDESGIETVLVSFGAFRIRLHWSLTDTDLIVATRREVVEAVRKAPRVDPGPHNLAVVIRPDRWKRVWPDMLLGYEEAARRACLRSLAQHEGWRDGEERRVLGRMATCPDGGSHSPREEAGFRCSLHGSPERPWQPTAPPAANPTMRLLEKLEDLTIALRFEGEGLRINARR